MSNAIKPRLFIFTNSFPFDLQYTEISFLKEEVEVMSRSMDLTIVPMNNEGNVLKVSEKIHIDDSLAIKLRLSKRFPLIMKFLNAFRYKYFFTEVLNCRSLLQLYNLLLNTDQIITIYKWAESSFKHLNNDKPIIFYTYWCTNITLGLAYLIEKREYDYRLISRAHGADLYLERHKFNPYYDLRIRQLDALFLISKKGKEYISKILPDYKEKYFVSYLGTKNKEFKYNNKSNPSVIIVSCSTINELKQVDVLYKSIHLFAIRRKSSEIKWVHIGGGALETELRYLVSRTKLINLTIEVTGVISNECVHHFYENNFVDCFIHASKSEGLPVSFMEAQSYGIPIISTNVGGVSEIVNKANGILIDEKADIINEIADAIAKIVFNSELREALKKRD